MRPWGGDRKEGDCEPFPALCTQSRVKGLVFSRFYCGLADSRCSFLQGVPLGKAWRSSSLGEKPDLLQPHQLFPSRLQPPSQRGLEAQAVSSQLSPPCSRREGADPGTAAQALQVKPGTVLWRNLADLLQVQRSGSTLLQTASLCSTSHPPTWSQLRTGHMQRVNLPPFLTCV